MQSDELKIRKKASSNSTSTDLHGPDCRNNRILPDASSTTQCTCVWWMRHHMKQVRMQEK